MQDCYFQIEPIVYMNFSFLISSTRTFLSERPCLIDIDISRFSRMTPLECRSIGYVPPKAHNDLVHDRRNGLSTKV